MSCEGLQKGKEVYGWHSVSSSLFLGRALVSMTHLREEQGRRNEARRRWSRHLVLETLISFTSKYSACQKIRLGSPCSEPQWSHGNIQGFAFPLAQVSIWCLWCTLLPVKFAFLSEKENDYPVFECRDCLFSFLWMFVQSKEAACYEDLWYHNKDVLGSNTNNIFDAFCSKSLVKLKFIYRRIFLTHSVQF